ncbi:MAG: NRDE family protein [Planctomycetes bacterium]|nr:NRDE family protein [Planctomycetota bacterium]
MCLLIVLRGYHPSHPVLVGANRDERIDRKSAPPGLWIGEHRRLLSPRDRVAGGTWLAIDDRGRFAGITNLAAGPVLDAAPSRGLLPHLALDQADLDTAAEVVKKRVAAAPHSGFQLVLCDGERTLVLRNEGGAVRCIDWPDPVLLVTNEHGPGDLELPGLATATAQRSTVELQLDALAPLLADRGGEGRHEVCKHGDRYGTVSSSLIAVPAGDPLELRWRYAAGPPDVTPYRNYGNLGRRLLPGDE